MSLVKIVNGEAVEMSEGEAASIRQEWTEARAEAQGERQRQDVGALRDSAVSATLERLIEQNADLAECAAYLEAISQSR